MGDHKELIEHHGETGETYFEDPETKMFYDRDYCPFKSVQENYFHQFEGEDLGLNLRREVVEIDGKKHIRTYDPAARVFHLKPMYQVRWDFKDPHQEVGGSPEIVPQDDGVGETPLAVEIDPRPATDFVDPPVIVEQCLSNPKDSEEEEIEVTKRDVVNQLSEESEFYIETLPQHHTCLICRDIFHCKKDMINHYKKSHPPQWLEKRGGKMSCPFPSCKHVNSKELMMLHMRVAHTNEKPFRCRQCGKGFVRKSGLRSHELIHKEEKTFKCHICEKEYRQKPALAYHLRSAHEGRKDLVCQYCQKKFSNRTHLRDHERIHFEERPYKCDKCGKTFKQLGHLTTHNKSCSGDKEHKCPLCGWAFATRGNMKQHIENAHSTVKKFSCEKCGKGFNRRDRCMRHQDKCTGKE